MNKMRLPLQWLRAAASTALRKCGWDILRINENFDPKIGSDYLCLIKVLRRYDIDLLLDVGASSGEFAERVIELGYGGRILCFEPIQACYTKLEALARRSPQITLPGRYAVGAARGTAELNIAGNSLSSSLLPMASAHSDVLPESKYIGTETVEVRTLDDLVLEELSRYKNVYVKIDVQGFEDSVIAGAAETLRRAKGVQIELSTTELYDGQVLMPEMLALLRKEGFELHALFPVFVDEKSGKQLQFDAILIRV